MLMLSRYKEESIRIGEDVEVTVVEIRGNVVRLGVTAPKEISVYRTELLDPSLRRRERKSPHRCLCQNCGRRSAEMPARHNNGDVPWDY